MRLFCPFPQKFITLRPMFVFKATRMNRIATKYSVSFNTFYLVEPNKSVTHTHSLYLYTGLSSKQEEHVACVVNNRLIQGEVCIAFSINAVQASLYLCSISSNCRYSDLILNNFQMFPK